MYLDSLGLKTLGLKSWGENVKVSSKASFHSPELISLGSHVRIDDFVVISGNVTIGSYVHLSVYSALISPRSSITIGDFVTLSFHTCVTSASDDFSGSYLTNPTVPREFTNVQDSPVIIREHVIVGAHSLVMPGVTLDQACAVGALSLVKNSIPQKAIYAGVPATMIGERSDTLLKLAENLI